MQYAANIVGEQLRAGFREIIAPHVRWIEKPTQQQEVAARDALLILSSAIQQSPHTTDYHAVCFGDHVGYLVGLERIFMALYQKRYREACSHIIQYMQENDISQYRVQAGLVCLLSEIEGRDKNELETRPKA